MYVLHKYYFVLNSAKKREIEAFFFFLAATGIADMPRPARGRERYSTHTI